MSEIEDELFKLNLKKSQKIIFLVSDEHKNINYVNIIVENTIDNNNNNSEEYNKNDISNLNSSSYNEINYQKKNSTKKEKYLI